MRHLIADEGYDPEALRRFLCKTGASGTVRAQVSSLNFAMCITAMASPAGLAPATTPL
jgi:hypothetical protein